MRGRHANVDQNQLRLLVAYQFEQLDGVAGLPDDNEPGSFEEPVPTGPYVGEVA